MEDSPNAANDDPTRERQSGAELTISRADLETLIGQAVRREIASQQAGPSSNPAETGECLGGCSYVLPRPGHVPGRGERALSSHGAAAWYRSPGGEPSAYGMIRALQCTRHQCR